MESIKDKLSTIVQYVQSKLLPNCCSNYHLVEHNKHLFYFSKFSIDIKEFNEIAQFVRTIKEHLFKSLIDQFKLCVKELLAFIDKSLSEKDKVMILFSACYLHYYLSFSYETNNTFAQYYTDDFFRQCERFRFIVTDMKAFKVFLHSFYSQMQNVLKMVNYAHVKRLYLNYNGANELGNKGIMTSSNSAFFTLNSCCSINDKSNNDDDNENDDKNVRQGCFPKKLLTHIIAAKEHIIDMVLELKQIEEINTNKKEMNYAKKCLQQMNSYSKDRIMDENITTMSMDMDMNMDNDMEIDNENKPLPKPQPIPLSNFKDLNSNNISFFSKRVLCELIKCEIDDKTKDSINELSHKVAELYLDTLLNQNRKNISIINPFLCYILEVNSSIIRTIEGYHDASDDVNLRFIVSAKDIYNSVFEIYITICDLSFTDINTFIVAIQKRNLNLKYARCLYSFFKGFTQEMLKAGPGADNKMLEVLEHFYKEQLKLWEMTITDKAQELTRFCLI